MSKVRVLFMGTPDFAVESLRRLSMDPHFEVVAVVSQPDRPAGRKLQLTPSPVKLEAARLGLQVFTPESVNKEEFRQQILAMGCESAVVVAFGQILGEKFLKLFPRGCVNLHASLLPRWRGAAPIQRAIMAGDEKTGMTLQVIVKELDAGAILGIREVGISDDMDARILHDRLMAIGPELLQIEFMDYLRGNLTPVPQAVEGLCFAPKISKEETHINLARWIQPARVVFNHLRGLTIGPTGWSQINGQKLKFFDYSLAGESAELGKPGELILIDKNEIQVACGKGALRFCTLQPESRAKMPVSEFLKGYKLNKGDIFQ